MACLVRGWECSQDYGGSSWGRTGSAGPGAPRGHRMWPVGFGILEEPLWLIQAVHRGKQCGGFASHLLSPSQR